MIRVRIPHAATVGQDFSFRDWPEIAKPFNQADLQRVVQEVLGREE